MKLSMLISSGRVSDFFMRNSLQPLVIRRLPHITRMSLFTKMKGSLTRGRFNADEQQKQVEADKSVYIWSQFQLDAYTCIIF